MISVCMATYNGEKYLREQVDSILAQLGPNDELIVSDDGSKDKTIDILLSYNDQRIKIFNHTPSGKSNRVGDIVSQNFENALQHAIGDYIFLSDQDDVWIEGKVSKMIEQLQQFAVVCSNAWIWDCASKNECCKLLYEGRTPLRNYILKGGKYYGCCMAIRKECLKYLLPFPNPMPLHDTWVGLLPEIIGGAFFLDEPLIYYRRHGENLSGGKSKNTLFYKIWHRVRLLFLVYYRVIRFKLLRNE